MGGESDVADIFSEGMYAKKESTLYLSKSKTKEDITEGNRSQLFSLHIKEIKKVEERFKPWRYVFLEIKPGVGARQTLSGGLEFKVDMGPGKSFELFNLSKEEYQKLKNYTEL